MHGAKGCDRRVTPVGITFVQLLDPKGQRSPLMNRLPPRENPKARAARRKRQQTDQNYGAMPL